MATITLKGSTTNPYWGSGSFASIEKAFYKTAESTNNLIGELNKLSSKINTASSVTDVSSSIQKTSNAKKREEKKLSSLSLAYDKLDTFISNAGTIDKKVAEKVNKLKKDFYSKYKYLRPDCEKGTFEKIKDGASELWEDTCEWCKEHWKLIATAVLVIGSVMLIVVTCGVALGPVMAALVVAAKGLIVGAVVGGLLGGTINAANGESFLKGFEEGAFSGAISGAISGGLGAIKWFGKGTKVIKALKELIIGSAGETGANFLSDLGDLFIKGEDISILDIGLNILCSIGTGTLLSGFSQGLGSICNMKFKGFNKGKDSWKFVWYKSIHKDVEIQFKDKIKIMFKGLTTELVDSTWGNVVGGIKSLFDEGLEKSKERSAAFSRIF